MADDRIQMTREEMILALKSAYEDLLERSSIDDLKSMTEQELKEKVDVINKAGRVISAPEQEDLYFKEGESTETVNEESEPYGSAESEDDDDSEWLPDPEDDESDEKEIGFLHDFAEKRETYGSHPAEEKQETSPKISELVPDNDPCFEGDVPKDLYDRVSFLYVLDAISQLGENEPLKATDIRKILQNNPDHRCGDRLQEFQRKNHYLFERHRLKKRPPKGDGIRPPKGAKYPSTTAILLDIKALLYACDPEHYGKTWQQNGALSRGPYRNIFRTYALSSGECILLALSILSFGFISKEEKRDLLTTILRISPECLEPAIKHMYGKLIDRMPFTLGKNKQNLAVTAKAMIGSLPSRKRNRKSDEEKRYYWIAFQEAEIVNDRGRMKYKIRNNDAWKLVIPEDWVVENDRLHLEGRLMGNLVRDRREMTRIGYTFIDTASKFEKISCDVGAIRHVMLLDDAWKTKVKSGKAFEMSNKTGMAEKIEALYRALGEIKTYWKEEKFDEKLTETDSLDL